MNIQRCIYQICQYGWHKICQIIVLRDLDDLLTEVVAELVRHQILEEWSDGVNESRCEMISLAPVVIEATLEHTAALLIIAVEIELRDNRLVLF